MIGLTARQDLGEASRDGDVTFGIEQMDRYVEDLEHVFDLIAEFPQLARE